MLARSATASDTPSVPGAASNAAGADYRAFIPPFGVSQCRRQCAQDAPGALKPLQLGPATVEHVDQVGMEGVTLAESVFFLTPVLLRGRVQIRQAAHDADDVRIIGVRVANAIRVEQPSPQHLGHVFPADGLDASLTLAPDDVKEIGLQGVPENRRTCSGRTPAARPPAPPDPPWSRPARGAGRSPRSAPRQI